MEEIQIKQFQQKPYQNEAHINNIRLISFQILKVAETYSLQAYFDLFIQCCVECKEPHNPKIKNDSVKGIKRVSLLEMQDKNGLTYLAQEP